MSVEVKVPRLDEVQETATITKWNKKVGDKVTKGEIIATIETMKVTFDIESPAEGKIEEILAQEGAELPVGAPICRIEAT